MKVSIVTSLYRSESFILEFCHRAAATAETISKDYEIVLVVDGSPDASLAKACEASANDPHIRVVDLSRNFGQHHALLTGLEYAHGDRVFMLDGDLEEKPEWLTDFQNVMNETGSDLVVGVQRKRKGSFFERISGSLFYWTFNKLANTHLTPSATTARLMSRRFVDSLLTYRERTLFLAGVMTMVGYEQRTFVVDKTKRLGTGYGLFRKIHMAADAITSFSDRPLILIFFTGASISCLAAVYILYLLIRWAVVGIPVMGWPSLIVSFWFLGGLIILFIGILGFYLSRIYIETKARPSTIVRAVYHAGQLLKEEKT